jgi:DNA-binding transcriptional LysR family regulator
MPTNLDPDCLRSLIAIAEFGSFARAAEWMSRTPSAISLQLRRLEDQTGAQLFEKQGRRRVLTEAGEVLLGFARRLIDTNDAAITVLSSTNLSGSVRFGATQDFADTVLPTMLGRFAQAYPDVRLSVRIDHSKALIIAVETGELDLVLAVSHRGNSSQSVVRRDAMLWIGSKNLIIDPMTPIPLVLFDPPCSFREAGLKALDRAGIEWRIVYSSPSLSGLRAAVKAGLGITVRTVNFIENGLNRLGSEEGLPALPDVAFSLYDNLATETPVVAMLRRIITDELSGAKQAIPHGALSDKL